MTALIAVGLIHGEGFRTAPRPVPWHLPHKPLRHRRAPVGCSSASASWKPRPRNGAGAPKLLKHEPKSAAELSTPSRSRMKPSAWRCARSPGRAPTSRRLLLLQNLFVPPRRQSRKRHRNPQPLWHRPSRAAGSSPAFSRPKPSYRPRPRSSRSEPGRGRCCTCSRGWAGTTRCCCSGFGDCLRGAGVSRSTTLRICSHSARRAVTT